MTAMKNLRPRTVREVRRLLGLVSVYHRHMKNFAQTAKAIYDLLNQDVSKKKITTLTRQSHKQCSGSYQLAVEH